jgi:hypothetical protein
MGFQPAFCQEALPKPNEKEMQIKRHRKYKLLLIELAQPLLDTC